MNTSSSYGMQCVPCNISVDISGAVGVDAEKCPHCSEKMTPNKHAKISAHVRCEKCKISFGIINSDRCPECQTPFHK